MTAAHDSAAAKRKERRDRELDRIEAAGYAAGVAAGPVDPEIAARVIAILWPEGWEDLPPR